MEAQPQPPTWDSHWAHTTPVLLLAGTDTAAVDGISAAGASPAARRQTAAADAELLLLGPGAPLPHALPPLPAGVSPALISHVVLHDLGWLARLVLVDLGCPVAPAVPHLRLPPPEGGSTAACLSSGRAMAALRVRALLGRGQRWGQSRGATGPVLVAECVPGGTSTALAVLQGLGIAATGLVGGSLRIPAHGLKDRLARQGLQAAGLTTAAAPSPAAETERAVAVLAAVGDPMQALAAGLCVSLAQRERPLLLAGGSQMAAVLALALALAPSGQRPLIARNTVVATTAWVLDDEHNDLRALLDAIGQRFGVRPQLQVAGLRFKDCREPALRDYERGYVKEGVGAGGLAWLWEQSGRSHAQLAAACDRACRQLLAT